MKRRNNKTMRCRKRTNEEIFAEICYGLCSNTLQYYQTQSVQDKLECLGHIHHLLEKLFLEVEIRPSDTDFLTRSIVSDAIKLYFKEYPCVVDSNMTKW